MKNQEENNKIYLLKKMIKIIIVLIFIFILNQLFGIDFNKINIKTFYCGAKNNLNGRILNGPKMNIKRSNHSSILLDNGDVLIVGGFDNRGLYVRYPEIYEVKNNKFILSDKTTLAHGLCSLIRRSDGRILLVDKHSIEIFDQNKRLFKSTNKTVFPDDKVSFRIVPVNGENAIVYTDNAFYYLNLYTLKLEEISKVDSLRCLKSTSDNKLIILQFEDYKTSYISTYNLSDNTFSKKHKFPFQYTCSNIVVNNDAIIGANSGYVYLYNYRTNKIIKKINNEENLLEPVMKYYSAPEILPLDNNQLLIYYPNYNDNYLLTDRIFLYDFSSQKVKNGPYLCFKKQTSANLVKLKDGSVLITGGQYKSPQNNNSNVVRFNTTQIYKP